MAIAHIRAPLRVAANSARTPLVFALVSRDAQRSATVERLLWSSSDLAGQKFSGFWAGGFGIMRRDSLHRLSPRRVAGGNATRIFDHEMKGRGLGRNRMRCSTLPNRNSSNRPPAARRGLRRASQNRRKCCAPKSRGCAHMGVGSAHQTRLPTRPCTTGSSLVRTGQGVRAGTYVDFGARRNVDSCGVRRMRLIVGNRLRKRATRGPSVARPPHPPLRTAPRPRGGDKMSSPVRVYENVQFCARCADKTSRSENSLLRRRRRVRRAT